MAVAWLFFAPSGVLVARHGKASKTWFSTHRASGMAVAALTLTPPMTPGTTGAPATLADHVVVEGETMWSIAQDVAPAGEAATYVERLVAANGGAVIVPGQVLTVPEP